MSEAPGTIWVTRSSPFNLLTAQRLRAMGLNVLTVPLLEVRSLIGAELPWAPDVLAFTSVHGVRHHPFRSDWVQVPVLAVGDTTAAAAQRRGYRDVRSARGAVAQLEALALRTSASGSRVVHYGAREPAGDLVGYLSARGFEAVHRAVYETVPVNQEGFVDYLRGRSRADAILVHSPKAARLLASLMKDAGWQGPVFCISKACAAELDHQAGPSLWSAPQPTEQALLELIARHFKINRHRLTGWPPKGVQATTRLQGLPAEAANDNSQPASPPA